MQSMEPHEIDALRELLRDVFRRAEGPPSYFSKQSESIPPNLSMGTNGELLEDSGLACWSGERMWSSARINKLGDVLVATDFPDFASSAENDDRVFPWADEGRTLLSYIRDTWHGPAPRNVLNMCCGPGTVALSLAKQWQDAEVHGVDNNIRAIQYADNNRILNKIRNCRFEHGDLFQRLGRRKYDLIVADPPFALQPAGLKEHSHSAGGALGDAVLRPLLAQAVRYLDRGGRLIVLCYSLGTKTEPTLVRGLLERTGALVNPLLDRVLHMLPKDEPIWRFKEDKAVPINPMPVRYMSIRCGDTSYKIHENPEKVRNYISWIEDLVERGYTHLHYLVVDICTDDLRDPR